ncbi:MAG: hypothetical protein AAF235_01665 [Planctomycetota bacterium]
MPELTVSKQVHFSRGARGRKRLGHERASKPDVPPRLPRVTRLMALAIRLDGLIQSGAVTDQAELARAGRVTRARVTQIMNLLHLAPDIQETLLDLPRVKHGRDPITERELRRIAAEIHWGRQRPLWRALAAGKRDSQ